MTKEILKDYMKCHEVQFIETDENFIVCPKASLQQEYLERWSNEWNSGQCHLPFDRETGKNMLGTHCYILIIDKAQF